jgi:hypothetical protein
MSRTSNNFSILSNMLPSQIIREPIKEWERQFCEKNTDIQPMDVNLNEPFADCLVQLINESFAVGDYVSDLTKKSEPHIDFESTIVPDMLGINKYGTIRCSEISLPVSLTVRAKYSKNSDSKIVDLNEKRIANALNVPFQMYDLVAGRFVVGRTDRELFKRPFKKYEFNPSSLVLDNVLRFMLHSNDDLFRTYNSKINFRSPDDAFYTGSELDVRVIKQYNHELAQITKYIWEKTKLKTSATNIVKNTASRLKGSILYEHLMEAAMGIDIYRMIVSEKALDISRNQNYSIAPKENGYGTNHLVYNLNSGWTMPVFRELQIRTGFQHVFASHPELAGHSSYKNNLGRNDVNTILPDYNSLVGDKIRRLVSLTK